MKSYERARQKNVRGEKNMNVLELLQWLKLCPTINPIDVCEKLNMKYNAHVFLPESAKGTSEVTQNA